MTNGPLPPAGWYPDQQAPEGHLRYWDGSNWTEHRWAPPAFGTDQPKHALAPATTPSPLAGWVSRHKFLTGFIAAVTVIWFFSAVSGSADDQSPSGGPSASDESSSLSGDSQGSSPTPSPKPKPRTYHVVQVVDGDTINLGNGQTVRLAGIDAPEVGECGHDRARNMMARLVLDKRVILAASDEDHDRYGRLLRYVDVDGTDAGLRLIKKGLAIARYDSRDGYGFHPREEKYIAADKASKNFTCARPAPLVSQAPQQNCAPGYSPCIAPYPPDLDCPDIGHPVHVSGSDPHRLDRDGDGIACEWS